MRAFGATNKPLTCMWCGAKLIKVVHEYDFTNHVKLDTPTVVGHGYGAHDMFCTLSCGYQFGRRMVELGKRLETPVDEYQLTNKGE